MLLIAISLLTSCDHATITTRGFDQRCEVDEDCKVVTVGNLCVACPQDFDVVNVAEFERYLEYREEKKQLADCPRRPPTSCASIGNVLERGECTEGKCTVDAISPFNETSCTDGIDNNVNGLTDCEDRDCLDIVCECGLAEFRCEEGNCGDGVDNNEDGVADCEDPRCADDALCL